MYYIYLNSYKMVKSYDTSHGIMECYPNFLVFKLSDNGISETSAKVIMSYAYRHYKKRPFVFISNREFASNVDPKAYNAIDFKRMVGLAIVSSEETVKQEAYEEQGLFKGSFSYFKTVDQAKIWADTVVKKS